MKSIHLSTARSILALRNPVKLTVVTAKGEIETYNDCTPLRADFRSGTRNVKLPNGQIRRLRDTMILAINDREVFL